MLASSLASRGLGNKKTDIETKKLRVLSCFGGIDDIPRCPYLMDSRVDKTKNYCGKCGCGDKKLTWLMADEMEYSKLDFPVLNCPAKMPGFTNYDPNFTNPEIKERKMRIENLDPEKLNLIQVTLGASEEKENIIAKVTKITENT